jgi:hypothetical protein
MEELQKLWRRDSNASEGPAIVHSLSLHRSNDVLSLAAMILTTASRYYFWYRYRKPAAEHGARS